MTSRPAEILPSDSTQRGKSYKYFGYGEKPSNCTSVHDIEWEEFPIPSREELEKSIVQQRKAELKAKFK